MPDKKAETFTTECPVFEFTGKAGETARLAVWNGNQNFANEFSTDIIKMVGGDRIAVVQVGKPVGRNGRSSVALSDVLVGSGFRGIIHWARDTETYYSIMREFKQRHLRYAEPPLLSRGWKPEIVILPCRD